MPFSQEEILAKIQTEIENLSDQKIPSPEQELFQSGILDSLNILHIIVFLESTFHIKIDPFAVNLEVLGSIAKMADFVRDNLPK